LQRPLKTIYHGDVDINRLKTIDNLDYLRLLSQTCADQCSRLERT